ncbi:gliding motility-associated C-terminal domain-containing protein [uncultured Winogradskyella sp.]|uniref:T9SS type B sorting domain-containing protein n=1 Tax=uncultured Winogradskyella sp. TaxID=395353 RepID=UPI002615D12C|nr:gliding motility-associated C-terminal domain-containing protein [uncultured Winogradskyella sp.]
MSFFRFTKILILSIYFLCFARQEKVNAQLVISTPDLGFSQACANNSFNSFSTSFTFSPQAALTATNQFSIEISDANGDFSNASVIYTSAQGEITTSPATLDFSIPETTAGENYRIRIKSSSPAATSTASLSFAAYFKLQDSPFTINNLVSTASFCSGGSYLLTIDNPGGANNDSPLNYPELTYNWHKELSPTTSEFVTQANSLEVFSEGTYFVETNYGSCTSNSFSNRVTVTEANSSNDAEANIVSSLGNPYCPEQELTTLTTLSGNSYKWFKDGVIIQDATEQTYQTNESGIFSVQVDLGECTAFGSIDLFSELFESSINVEETNFILSDETLTVTITDNAISPQYQWFLNQEPINTNTNTYDTNEFGDYEVIISETAGSCNGSISYQFTVAQTAEPFPDVDSIPNVISPNGDLINDTWVLPLQYVTGTNTEVVILNEQGRVVFQTIDYQNNWPENDLNLTSVNQLFYYIITTAEGSVKKGSITIVK